MLGSVTGREHVNSGLKTLSAAKPCAFSGKVASVVSQVGSLFPRLRASICKSYRQKVHTTVSRARFALENVKKQGWQNLHETVARARFHIKKR